jgi:hypothetical protein
VTPTSTSPSTPTPTSVGEEQTRDRPSAKSPAFEKRAKALFDAIASDRPETAHDAFFPLPAYQKVKDVANPAADWRRRLLAAFDRDIHDLHLKLGDHAADARFTGLDVPEERARWVEPGEEYNKVGYFRVFGSQLRYEADGRARAFPVKSLISWRGEWYVVHLSGIK